MNQHRPAGVSETLHCADGYPLRVTVFSAAEEARKNHSVVIGSALGIGQAYYHPLAAFFAEQGLDCYCFDYRGTANRPDNYSDYNADLANWGRQDIQAVLTLASERSERCFFIGHSIGGQLFALAKSAPDVDRVVLVAASAPHWTRWPFPQSLSNWLSTRAALPLAARLLKDFPTKKFAIGNLLIDSRLIQQWCHWMASKDYLLDPRYGLDAREQFLQCQMPLLTYGFSDDGMAPESNIDKLLSFYANTDSRKVMVDPTELGQAAIGHNGLFRAQFENTLWQEMLTFFESTT